MTAGLETFAKVRALHDATTSPGEKASAAARMQDLAARAGMTVAEAVSKLDAPRMPSPVQGAGLADFFDTPFFRDALAEGERKRAVRWREVLDEYGTEEAVFEPGLWERALADACDPYRAEDGYHLRGWEYVSSRGDPSPEIVAAITTAYPMPATVQEAWVEFAFWDKLGRDREARGVACGDHSPEVQFRVVLVERILDGLPARTMNDLRARMSWMDWLNDLESTVDPEKQRERLATLRADIERMGRRLREQDEAAVQNGHQGTDRGTAATPTSCPATAENSAAASSVHSGHPRRPTRAERHAAIRALLADGHTDREVARRLGISPTTVGAVRRQMEAQHGR